MSYGIELEAHQAQIQAAADQKRAVELAEQILQTQNRTLLLAENEQLKAQILRNIYYLNGRTSSEYEIITAKLETGYVLAIAEVGSKTFLLQSGTPGLYSVESVNVGLHKLHKHYAENVAKEIVAGNWNAFG